MSLFGGSIFGLTRFGSSDPVGSSVTVPLSGTGATASLGVLVASGGTGTRALSGTTLSTALGSVSAPDLSQPVPGSRTSFWLEDAGGTVTDISAYLAAVSSTSEAELIDGTTFRAPDNPGQPIKFMVPGPRTKGLTLTVVWSAAAEAFFTGIADVRGLQYEYGPEGRDPGDMKIYGICDGIGWTGPASAVGSITTAQLDLTKVTELHGTY